VLRRGCQGRCELRIGLCVLGRVGRAEFSKTGWLDQPQGLYGFRASKVAAAKGASAVDELVECVRWARRNQVHVLCFPELAIDPAGRTVLGEAIAADPGSLCVVIPGSFHELARGTDGWVNRAPVWLVERVPPAPDGAGPKARVFAAEPFDKTDPFIFKAKKAEAVLGEAPDGCLEYREDIDAGTALTVVDSPAGRIGLAICKDAMRGPLLERYGQVADHFLVVSMNEQSTGWFWTSGETLARRDAVAAFYVNSTQDVPEQDSAVDLAFWCFPEQTQLTNVVYRRKLPPSPAASPEAAPLQEEKVQLADRRAFAAPIPPEYAVFVPIRIPGTVFDT
jgi:hypothetical protein